MFKAVVFGSASQIDERPIILIANMAQFHLCKDKEMSATNKIIDDRTLSIKY
jgi:hypothetical protein